MLGRLKLKNQYLFAPMSMYTDVAFRRVCEEYGCSYGFSEQIFASEFVAKSEHLKRKLDFQRPCGIQFLSNSPEELKKAIDIIKKKEFYHNLENITSIDLNLGCPSEKIRKLKLGSELLKEHTLLEQLFTALRRYSHLPVSAKIRLAVNAKHLKGKPYLRVAKLAEKCKLDFITVHGRTSAQMYEGEVDYDAIRKVNEAVNIAVVGNGNVVDFDSAKHMLTCAKALMIGRKAITEPFIFGAIQGKKYSTQKEKMDCIVKYLKYAKLYNVGFQQIKVHVQSLFKDTVYSDQIDELTHLKSTEEIFDLVDRTLREK